MGDIIMEGVYTVAILIFIIVWCIINHAVCMSGYTTKSKNPDDYMEINRKQREKDIAQVKAQDKYDNDWGYIR